MYNKAKRIVGMIAGIFTLINGVLCCYCALMAFICSMEQNGGAFLLLTLLNAGFGVPMIVFGSQAVKKPVKVNDKWKPSKGVQIAMLVVNAALVVYSFYAIVYSAIGLDSIDTGTAGFSAVMLILTEYCLIFTAIPPVPLYIVALALKTESDPEPAPVSEPLPVPAIAESAPSLSKEEVAKKIGRLKEWKEEGIITEEQYRAAVDKLMQEFVK